MWATAMWRIPVIWTTCSSGGTARDRASPQPCVTRWRPHCRELGVDAVTVHASKTALPFFLGRGYAIEREQQVPCRGQVLTNYALEKIL